MAGEDSEGAAPKRADAVPPLTLEVDGSERVVAKAKDRERYVWFLPAFFVVLLLLSGLAFLFSPQIMTLPRIVVLMPSVGAPSQAVNSPPVEKPASLPGPATVPVPAPDTSFAEAAASLDLSPEAAALGDLEVQRALRVLNREHCDSRALQRLAVALGKADFRRDAARAQIAFSRRCGGHWGFLYEAANTLFSLNDNAAVIVATDPMIALQPHDTRGYYLRALAQAKLGEHRKAVDDFITTIELVGFKERVRSGVFVELSQSYEALGQFCDAATAIDAWVAVDRADRDTSQTRALIAKHEARGNCAANSSGDRETIRVSEGNVAIVPVLVNGVRGQFIVDTGASFVSVPRAFATKAGIQVDEGSSLMLHTANGVAKGKLGRANEIAVRGLSSQKVPVVVREGPEENYGPGIDGLLGMSFLSRFDVTISSGSSSSARAALG